ETPAGAGARQGPDGPDQDPRPASQKEGAGAPLSGEPAPDGLPAGQTAEEGQVPDQKDLVLEQWLRQVPDDPSGLLRRKFMLEHQRRQRQGGRP
ncbi:MAG: hypothetical protein AB1634_15585, partial [Thermodesulfobacteriota bacterium]